MAMRCGAKCFMVEIEREGKKETLPVTARTSAGARKVVRLEHGEGVEILAVKEERK